MWLLDEKGPGVVLLRRRPPRAVILAGALGVVVSFSPLVMAPNPSGLRLLTFAALLCSSLSLLWLGLPRRERIELRLDAGGLSWGAERLPAPAWIALAGDDTEDPPRYRADVVWPDGRRRHALAADDPALVLNQAVALAERLGVELRPGWGLERHFSTQRFVPEYRALAAGSSALSREPLDTPLWHAQRRSGAITVVAGVFVLMVTFSLVESPARSVGPSAFSLALPVLSAATVVAVGVVTLGLRRRIRLTPDGVTALTMLFGSRLGKERALGGPAVVAFGVAPDGGDVRHLLFASSGPALSVTADPELARELAERVARTLVREDAPSRLRTSEPTLQAAATKSSLR